MRIARKILIKSAISLFAGVASAVGMRAGGVIWDMCSTMGSFRKN